MLMALSILYFLKLAKCAGFEEAPSNATINPIMTENESELRKKFESIEDDLLNEKLPQTEEGQIDTVNTFKEPSECNFLSAAHHFNMFENYIPKLQTADKCASSEQIFPERKLTALETEKYKNPDILNLNDSLIAANLLLGSKRPWECEMSDYSVTSVTEKKLKLGVESESKPFKEPQIKNLEDFCNSTKNFHSLQKFPRNISKNSQQMCSQNVSQADNSRVLPALSNFNRLNIALNNRHLYSFDSHQQLMSHIFELESYRRQKSNFTQISEDSIVMRNESIPLAPKNEYIPSFENLYPDGVKNFIVYHCEVRNGFVFPEFFGIAHAHRFSSLLRYKKYFSIVCQRNNSKMKEFRAFFMIPQFNLFVSPIKIPKEYKKNLIGMNSEIVVDFHIIVTDTLCKFCISTESKALKHLKKVFIAINNRKIFIFEFKEINQDVAIFDVHPHTSGNNERFFKHFLSDDREVKHTEIIKSKQTLPPSLILQIHLIKTLPVSNEILLCSNHVLNNHILERFRNDFLLTYINGVSLYNEGKYDEFVNENSLSYVDVLNEIQNSWNLRGERKKTLFSFPENRYKLFLASFDIFTDKVYFIDSTKLFTGKDISKITEMKIPFFIFGEKIRKHGRYEIKFDVEIPSLSPLDTLQFTSDFLAQNANINGARVTFYLNITEGKSQIALNKSFKHLNYLKRVFIGYHLNVPFLFRFKRLGSERIFFTFDIYSGRKAQNLKEVMSYDLKYLLPRLYNPKEKSSKKLN